MTTENWIDLNDIQAVAMSQERLKHLFSYDAETGLFVSNVRRGPQKAGTVAGTINSRGYIIIRVDTKNYAAHRLAWVFAYGEWPIGYIDHMNGVKTDNRLCNLRCVNQSENIQNVSKPHIDNVSGYLGVSKNKKKWRAKIVLGGTIYRLGTWPTTHEAHAAYLGAKSVLHTGWIRQPHLDMIAKVPE